MGFASARATAHLAPPPTHHVATAHTEATALQVSSSCMVACATSTVNLAAPKDAAFPNVSSATKVAGAAYTVAPAPPKDTTSSMSPPVLRWSTQPTRWSPRPPKTDPSPGSLSRQYVRRRRQLGDPRRPNGRR